MLSAFTQMHDWIFKPFFGTLSNQLMHNTHVVRSKMQNTDGRTLGQCYIPVKPQPSLEKPNQQLKTSSIYGIKSACNDGERNWGETFWYLVDRYGQKTNIHGLDRICQRRTGRKERLIWTLGFLAALYLLTTIYALVSERYRRKQFKTVVNETLFRIYRLPFPEVVICNANRLNWLRLESAKDEYLAPEDRTKELEDLFTNIIGRYDNLTLNAMDAFKGLAKDSLEVLDHVNFTNVAAYMTWRCHEIIWNCTWRWRKVDCCELFLPRRTLLGHCLAFNTILTPEGKARMKNDSYWPLHYGRNGRGSGLTFNVLINEKFHYPESTNKKGVAYMVKDPVIYSDYVFTEVRANNIARVAINSAYTFHDDLTRSVNSKERNCVFDNERNSKDFVTLTGTEYNFENCFYECRRQRMIASCNCTMDLFFPPSSHPVCRLTDMPCLALNYDKFNNLEAISNSRYMSGNNQKTSTHCNCLLSCHSLILDVTSHTDPQKPMSQLGQMNDSYVEMDLYWRNTYITTYRTSLVFSWLDLLVSFGGIASLLLGCSLMSIVELLYFLFCDAPEIIWKKHRSEKRIKELKTRRSIKKLLDYDRNH